MKKKRNYDISHRSIRVLAADYEIFAQISRRTGLTISESVHEFIEALQRHEGHQLSLPVTMARSTPVKIEFSHEVKSDIRYR
jgi:hypothetical protein